MTTRATPVIALTMRVVRDPAHGEPRDAIAHDWIRFMEAHDVTPVLIPNVLRDPASYLRTVGARGLILTGGENVGPLTAGSDDPPSDRDRSEAALLTSALDAALPVLGVCRGLQLINAVLGGEVMRDLDPIAPHVNVRHGVTLLDGVPCEWSGPRSLTTNSFHRQGVVVDGLAAALRPFAVADGGIVEGLRHDRLPVVAVQWHPERPHAAGAFDEALFGAWLQRCA
jgi:gamma-glutamyl-gamma-aminobutyrate hydrolase PuuD